MAATTDARALLAQDVEVEVMALSRNA